MRLLILFALFIISASCVAQTGNSDEDYETAGVYYEQGDYNNAFRYLLSAAKLGNANAQNDVANMYKTGEGVSQSYTNAYQWYLKAANQGHFYAQNNLGDLYFEGNGVKKDYLKAYEWYLKAAEKAYADAQFNVGYLYDNGYGVKLDYMKAFEWYSKAAKQNHISAQYQLAVLYENGYGVKEDVMKAFEWYTKAADEGHSAAQNNLGFLYYKGKGVKQDYIKAYEWFSRSAENGEPAAMYHLGEMFLNGEGINKDYTKAESWLKKTIDSDPTVPFPYSTLAILYAQRDKDYTKALHYSDKAIALFNNDWGSANQEASLYGERGLIYFWQDDKTNAEKMLAKCLAINSDYLKGNDDFAKLMSNKTQKQESILKEDIIHADHNLEKCCDTDSNIVINPITNKRTFAIIIGNEKYKNEVDVPFAHNDAKVFVEYVEKTLGVPHDHIRYIENASYNDIRIAINWLTQAMIVCRGSGKAIVYYAGHGIPDESDLSSYLLPVDGIANDPGSAYSLKEMYEKLGRVEAQSVTIFLDACFSGSKREEGMLASARGVALKAKQSSPQGNVIVFSAAQGNETAYPYKDKKHGMFTYFLLKKLQETKGEVTLGDLSECLADEVGRQSFIKNNKIQTPTVSVAPSLQNSWKSLKLK